MGAQDSMVVDKFTVAINMHVRNKDFGENPKKLTENFKNHFITAKELAMAIDTGCAVVFAEMIQNEQGGIHRCSEAFKSSQTVAVDIDNCIIINGQKQKVPDSEYFSLEQAYNDQFIKDNCLLLYTTSSHTPEWHRFRIVFRLPRIITDANEYKTIMKALVFKFNADKACTDPCRIFFGSANSNPSINNKAISEDVLNELLSVVTPVNKTKKEHVSKAIVGNAPKLPLEQIRAMLQHIADKKGKLDYNEWLILISALFDKYTLEEIKPILIETIGEEKSGEYEEKYKNGLDRIPFDKFIDIAKQCGYHEPITFGADFIVLSDSGKPRIHSSRLLDFLYESGFRKYYLPDSNDYRLIKIEDNIASVTSASRIKTFIQYYLEATLDHDNFLEQLLEQLVCGTFLTNDKLEYLRLNEFDFQRDSECATNIYLSNGFIEVKQNSDKIKTIFKMYPELNGIIWQRWQKNHDWHNIDKPSLALPHRIPDNYPNHSHRHGSGQFEQFVDHICNCEPQRIDALKTGIGYLLHAYKAPSVSKAVVLCDEQVSEHPSGGTGKSLLAQALAQVRTVADEDGKRFDTSNRFAFQNVNTDTQIVVLDDITKDFDFEALFHLITGDFEYEPKGLPKVKIPYSIAPKFVLTTNFTVLGHGNSFKRRMAEYEIAPWYNENFSPVNDFGCEFFTQWCSDEWVLFFSYMAHCIKCYLKNGLITPEPKNLNHRKLLQKTSTDFVEFMTDRYIVNGELNNEALRKTVTKSELFHDFCDTYTDWRIMLNNGSFSVHIFGRWLTAFATYNDLTIHNTTQRQNGKVVRVISFTK